MKKTVKKKSTKPKPASLFNPICSRKADAAPVVGLKERRFSDILKEGAPGCEPGSYDLREIVPWFIQRAVQQEQAKAQTALLDQADEVENPYAIGSPMLERLREERWKRERIKRQEEEGEFVPLVIMEELLNTFANLIREHGLRLQRQFGNEAGEMHNQICQDIGRKINDRIYQLQEERNKKHVAG